MTKPAQKPKTDKEPADLKKRKDAVRKKKKNIKGDGGLRG